MGMHEAVKHARTCQMHNDASNKMGSKRGPSVMYNLSSKCFFPFPTADAPSSLRNMFLPDLCVCAQLPATTIGPSACIDVRTRDTASHTPRLWNFHISSFNMGPSFSSSSTCQRICELLFLWVGSQHLFLRWLGRNCAFSASAM